MTFPLDFHIFNRTIPSHLVMEAIGYCVGFQAYLLLRGREIDSMATAKTHVWIVAGMILGALLGSKILAIVESWPEYWAARANPLVWLEGKTIVGGLLGGWIGVEIVKYFRGVRGSTGDAYVLPLILGIAVGRIGCFLTGLADHTHGNHTALPWGIDFGDGPRHPTQLYEIASLMLIALSLSLYAGRGRGRGFRTSNHPGEEPSPQPSPCVQGEGARRGELFRIFLLLYFCFRFAVEFIKPTYKPYIGTSAIQIASLIGAVVCAVQLARMRSRANERYTSIIAG